MLCLEGFELTIVDDRYDRTYACISKTISLPVIIKALFVTGIFARVLPLSCTPALGNILSATIHMYAAGTKPVPTLAMQGEQNQKLEDTHFTNRAAPPDRVLNQPAWPGGMAVNHPYLIPPLPFPFRRALHKF